jgi:NAD(P)-dependent dehydrogenase (short-subunit alcohol dehydrogenase family)
MTDVAASPAERGSLLDLTGRTALVTGAGAGIGQAIARRLAGAGARVAVNDIRPDLAAGTADELCRAGATAFGVPGDMTDSDEVSAVVGACVERLGGLDIAVNNVGMMGGLPRRAFVDIDAAYARRVLDLNLMSALLCGVAEAGAMIRAGRGGVIVNVSSGETTRAAPGMAVYGMAKTAINHLTRTMAVELGPAGIRVNAVAPGTTPTADVRAALSPDFLEAIAASTPLRRTCEPDDLARLVLLLVSDHASAVTGQFVLADVGAHLSLSRPALPEHPPGGGQAPPAGG